MLPKKWVIKDSSGEAVNVIVADEDFVSSNYERYEPFFSAEEEAQHIEESKKINAREWRNSELSRTDALMLLPDHPQKEELSAYRQALRDWPSQEGWPDIDRPSLVS